MDTTVENVSLELEPDVALVVFEFLASRKNLAEQAEILSSTGCACFYCRATFAPAAIEEWVDEPAPGAEGHAHSHHQTSSG